VVNSETVDWYRLLLEATTCISPGSDVYSCTYCLSGALLAIYQAKTIDVPIIICFISMYTAVLYIALYTNLQEL
jgi:hypothetical protein